MKTEQFDFELPSELIANHPCEPREQARMLCLDRVGGNISDQRVGDLPGLLREGDLLVVNDTKVTPARVHGYKTQTGGAVEILFLQPDLESDSNGWRALLKSSKRPLPGTEITLSPDASVEFEADLGGGECRLRYQGARPLEELLEDVGETPLPPYIDRREANAAQRNRDREDYQTVFAVRPGAVAAPTAGLHFTPELLSRIEAHGIRKVSCTLHVGLGTFKPVQVDDVEAHRMHAERYELSSESATAIRETRATGGRVIAVGTTTVRTLESIAKFGEIQAAKGETEIFIYPPFEFQAVDALITNFHLPKSTLLMMISAFAGFDFVRQAYAHAVENKYRFFSFGDCMFIQ